MTRATRWTCRPSCSAASGGAPLGNRALVQRLDPHRPRAPLRQNRCVRSSCGSSHITLTGCAWKGAPRLPATHGRVSAPTRRERIATPPARVPRSGPAQRRGQAQRQPPWPPAGRLHRSTHPARPPRPAPLPPPPPQQPRRSSTTTTPPSSSSSSSPAAAPCSRRCRTRRAARRGSAVPRAACRTSQPPAAECSGTTPCSCRTGHPHPTSRPQPPR